MQSNTQFPPVVQGQVPPVVQGHVPASVHRPGTPIPQPKQAHTNYSVANQAGRVQQATPGVFLPPSTVPPFTTSASFPRVVPMPAQSFDGMPVPQSHVQSQPVVRHVHQVQAAPVQNFSNAPYVLGAGRPIFEAKDNRN